MATRGGEEAESHPFDRFAVWDKHTHTLQRRSCNKLNTEEIATNESKVPHDND